MEMTFLRGATVIFSDGNKRLICDPWLEDGIYYGAWAHFPPYMEEDWRADKPTDVDYIYISHVHPDHFDPKTLSRFKGQKVIIHKYVSPFLRKKIEGLGFEVIELDNGAAFNMGAGFDIRVFAADDCDPAKCGVFFKCAPGVRSAQLDSLAVISTPETTVVNVNDCPWGLGNNLAAKIGNDYRVDAACVAYALAGAFPHCYKMRPVERAKALLGRANTALNLSLNWAKALKTNHVLPFAGDYQLCGRLSDMNETRGVPDIEQVLDFYKNAGINAIGNGMSSDRRVDYVCDVLSKRKLDYEDDPEPDISEFVELLPGAFEHFSAKRKEYDYKARSTVHVKVGDDFWYVIPPEGQPRFTHRVADEKFLTIETDLRLLKKLLMGPKHAHWNNAEIGSHLTFERRDSMEFGLQLLMSYFHVA